MDELAIQIININNLALTKDAIFDIRRQTSPYFLRVVDQGSVEPGTQLYLEGLPGQIEVVLNKENVPLNHLWNKFYFETAQPYLCFLNNDVRIPTNFVADTLAIFNKEPNVGIVIHSTNHLRFQKTTSLNYRILDERYVQGWDFSIRRECFSPIPLQLKFFGGDEVLYHVVYQTGYKVAVALSSPIIHYNSKSRRSATRTIRREDQTYLREVLGIERVSFRNPYTKWHPHFEKIIERRIR